MQYNLITVNGDNIVNSLLGKKKEKRDDRDDS